jgi:hypothetical protein
MSRAFCLVFGQLSVGGFLTLAFVPPRALGRGFYGFAGSLYAVLFLVATRFSWAAFGVEQSAWTVAFAGVVVLHAVASWARRAIWAYGLVWAGIPVGFGHVVGSALLVQRRYGIAASQSGLVAADFLLSALLTGSALTAMLFGHWYLTTPDLPTRYLRRLGNVILGLLLTAGLWTAFAAWSAREALAEVGLLSFGSLAGAMLWARWLFGLGAASVFGLLTAYCLREDSTQAATGFLYLVVCFLLMGELLDRYLLERMQLPL